MGYMVRHCLKKKKAGGMVEVTDHLPSICETLGLIASIKKKLGSLWSARVLRMHKAKGSRGKRDKALYCFADGHSSSQGSGLNLLTPGPQCPVAQLHRTEPPHPTARAYASIGLEKGNPRHIYPGWQQKLVPLLTVLYSGYDGEQAGA
jgi:hypothetical protein